MSKECSGSSPTAYYYHRETLMHASRIEESAVINWKLAVALVVAWLLAYLCIIKSIQSSGKVGLNFYLFREDRGGQTPVDRDIVHG